MTNHDSLASDPFLSAPDRGRLLCDQLLVRGQTLAGSRQRLGLKVLRTKAPPTDLQLAPPKPWRRRANRPLRGGCCLLILHRLLTSYVLLRVTPND